MMELNLFGKIKKVPSSCDCEIELFEKEQQKTQKSQYIRRKEEIFSKKELGSEYESSSFKDWKVREGTKLCSIHTKRFVKNILDGIKPQSLILFGGCGNGKTELIACANNYLSQKGFNCIFITVLDLILTGVEAYQGTLKFTERQFYNAIRSADAIFLDDFGAETYNDKRAEIMFNVIDIIWKNKIPVILTMNDFAIDKLVTNIQTKRVMDRLKGLCLPIENKADTYRDIMQEENFKNVSELSDEEIIL